MSVLPSDPPARAPHSYSCGTLKYTTFGLIMVCVWLLWGDFVWTLLDQSIPNILPLKLKDMGSSDTANIFLNKTLGQGIVFMFAPLVGFYSDRRRGRWGRRIPFLFWSTPFVGLFMILIGYYDSITQALVGQNEGITILGLFSLGRTTLALVVLGVLLVGYDMANIFVNTLYWYLFNDVVPDRFMARFLALFRLAGMGAGALFSQYIFPHSLDYFRLLWVVGGLVYVAGFVIMCLTVKEGQYPPPPENVDKKKGLWSATKTFAKECFTHRFYWYFFLMNTFLFLSWQSGMFRLPRDRDSLHLTLQQIGTMNAWTSVISMIIMFPAAWIADWINPVRLVTITTVICFLSPLAQCIWIFTDFGPYGNLVGQYIIALALLPIGAVGEAAGLPMYMRLLPKARYGQFCSANATVRSFAMFFGSIVAGQMMDYLKDYAHMGDWRYRYYALWVVVFQVPAVIFQILLYRGWKARGGDKGYVPPEV